MSTTVSPNFQSLWLHCKPTWNTCNCKLDSQFRKEKNGMQGNAKVWMNIFFSYYYRCTHTRRRRIKTSKDVPGLQLEEKTWWITDHIRRSHVTWVSFCHLWRQHFFYFTFTFHTSVSIRCVIQMRHTNVSYKCVVQMCRTNVSYKCVHQMCMGPWVKGCLSYMADTVIDGNVLTWSSGHDWASEPDEPVAGAGVDFEESDAATFSSLAWSTSSKIRTKLFYETKCQQTSAAGRLLHDIVLIYTIWAFSLNMQIYQAPSSPLHRWFCLL